MVASSLHFYDTFYRKMKIVFLAKRDIIRKLVGIPDMCSETLTVPHWPRICFTILEYGKSYIIDEEPDQYCRDLREIRLTKLIYFMIWYVNQYYQIYSVISYLSKDIYLFGKPEYYQIYSVISYLSKDIYMFGKPEYFKYEFTFGVFPCLVTRRLDGLSLTFCQ